MDASFSGAMGLVWAVTDAHTGRRYAIKTVKPETRDRPGVLNGFLEEARTWIALDQHPHLVQALWLIDHDPGPFLVLEYVDGRTLADLLLADGSLSLPRALDLAMQCAAGLAYAHAKPVGDGVGVVHRDLKPSNLLVTHHDLLKVSDFGLARVFRVAGEAPKGVAGTPAYLAPEQLQTDATIDGRTDIYAFGLVVYEMLTGANPLRADTLPEQLHRVLHETPPPLSGVPPGIAALVARCVAKDPARRPRGFAEILPHLARAARGLTHPWYVDPAAIEAPSEPAGVAVGPPVLRPRRPRAGEPFTVALEIQGDLGRGPVDVEWKPQVPVGAELLTPPEGRSVRVGAGGLVRLNAQLDLIAAEEGDYHFPESHISVAGPMHTSRYPVSAFDASVAMSFLLPWVGPPALEQRLRRTIREPGGALLVFGDVGAGKSRLLIEATRLAAEADYRVVKSRADATGLRPMRVLNDLAREVLEISAGPAQGVRSAVHDLLGHDPPTARYFAEVLLGGSSIEAEAPLAHRWYALLEAAARRQPLVILVDDLPHADEVAMRVLFELAVRARRARLPVAFVATARTSHDNAAVQYRLELLRGWTSYATTELAPLAKGEIETLLGAMFPGHGFGDEAPWLLRTIAAVTRGNPLYVVEILRMLRTDEGLVQKRDGEWHVSAELTPGRLRERVPGELTAVVQRRLLALTPDERRVAKFAGVIGEEFDVPVLKAAVRDDDLVDDALAGLEDALVVRPVANVADRYRFLGTIARVVRAALPEGDVRRLHRAVADAMLQCYRGEARVRRALAIAHHLRAGAGRRESLPFTLLGCRRLLSLQLNERARRLLSNAQPLAEDPAVPEPLRARFWYLYGLACETTGDYDEGFTALTRFVESEVEFDDDRRSLPRAHLRLGRIHQARGEYERAGYCFNVARELYEGIGDVRRASFVIASLGSLALERGDAVAGERYLNEARRLAEETGNEGAAIMTRNLEGRLLLFLDQAHRAEAAFSDAEKRARVLGERGQRAAAAVGLARVALRTGYVLRARRWIEEALDLFSLMGSKPEVAAALLRKGDIERRLGRADGALKNYRRAQRVFMDVGQPEGIATARRRVGRLLHLRGDVNRAVRELAAAAETYGELGRLERYPTLRELGRALLDHGSERAARIALVRGDRGDRNRARRVLSRTWRARYCLDVGDTARARYWARRSLRHARKTTGHSARIAANLVLADVALVTGELHEARRAAETAGAFAHEVGDLLSAAHSERVLLVLAAWAGGWDETKERAHRAARAYTGRHDAGDGPARLLRALARGHARLRPDRAARYEAAAARCYGRLERRGFRPPEGVLDAV